MLHRIRNEEHPLRTSKRASEAVTLSLGNSRKGRRFRRLKGGLLTCTVCHPLVETGDSLEGVSLDSLFEDIKTDAQYTMVHWYGDYTTNLPLDLVENCGEPARLLKATRPGSAADGGER